MSCFSLVTTDLEGLSVLPTEGASVDSEHTYSRILCGWMGINIRTRALKVPSLGGIIILASHNLSVVQFM